jgi:hypothetical protein
MTLPNTFIVGAPKCGTTYLAAWLGESSDVFAPRVKEPGFFAEMRQYQRGLDHYASAYYREVGSEPIVLDATPWYLYPRTVPVRIAESVGTNVRIIVLVRDPVSRAVSMYYDQVSRLREDRTLVQAVADDLAVTDPAGAVAQEAGPEVVHHYVLCGLYADPVARYRQTFGPDAVKVIAAEDLWGQPELVRAELGPFLGVKVPPAPERAANPASRPHLGAVEHLLSRIEGSSSQLRNMVGRLPIAAGGLRRLMDQTARWNQVATEYPRPEPELTERLAAWYRPSNQRLEEMLGRRFAQWH